MSGGINDEMKNKVLGLFLMKFKLSPVNSFGVLEKWFHDYPNQTWEFLYHSLKNGLIRWENGEIISLYNEKIINLVNDIRGDNGIEIKDRNYKLRIYPQCFIGNNAVEWMCNKYNISIPEALKLGQQLIEEKIIHHVTDDHDFKNAYLFYRFYIDE